MEPLFKTTHQHSPADHFLLEAKNPKAHEYQPAEMITSRFFSMVVGIVAAIVAAYSIAVNDAFFVLNILSH